MKNRFKYPRTPHLPWSPGFTGDDLRYVDVEVFKDKEVVVTEKLDGENTSLYRDHCHARSLDSKHHPSRDWVKQFHGRIRHDIPAGWRVCGENVFAQHSIAYNELESYFYGFSIWNDENCCLSWDDTLEWFAMLGICAPHIFYRGIWDEARIKTLKLNTNRVEGFVVRTVASFAYDQFATHVAKWVRQGHVQTDKHWMFAEVVPNGLKEGEE